MTSKETLLNRATPKIRSTILELRKFTLDLSDLVEERYTKKMICYHTKRTQNSSKKGRGTKGLTWINLSNGSFLRIHLRKNGNYKDPYNKIVPKGWGEYTEITFKENDINAEVIEYLKSLIIEAYSS